MTAKTPNPGKNYKSIATYQGDIELYQEHSTKRALFAVRYFLQLKTGLTYAEAAHELGECVLHALACDGALNNGGA